jgi:hypothetical protein
MLEIFDHINWVLKKTEKEPVEESDKFNEYIFNRWLSMADPDIAKIINITYNRWNLDDDILKMLKFYRKILPKIKKNINYIKKKVEKSEEENSDLKLIAKSYELSEKEILNMENLKKELEVLKNINN